MSGPLRNAIRVLAVVFAISGIVVAESAPVQAAGFTSVDTGAFHSCALTAAAGVKCWGYNEQGQLGNGTTTNSSLLVDVGGLTSGVSAISVGSYHNCALTNQGAVECWGSNVFGQLGDGTTTSRSSPQPVSGLVGGVAAIAASQYHGDGRGHTCALMSAGDVKCWGNNGHGQLGDGTIATSSVPVDVSGLTGVTAISAGGSHTCALLASGGMKCWGYNSYGQLGTGSTANSPTPVEVSGLDVTAISAGGAHTCAVLSGGEVKCWGSMSFGQLGNGVTGQFAISTLPVDVIGLPSAAVDISAGGYHTCAAIDTGGIMCWGLDSSGQLGDGSATSSDIPLSVVGSWPTGSVVVAGGLHTCAVAPPARLWCWGRDFYGQLGDGGTTNSWTPVEVTDKTGDADGDGCSNVAEQQTSAGSEATGGRRNPIYFWDLYDVWTRSVSQSNWVRSGGIDLFGDIFGVVLRYGTHWVAPVTGQAAVQAALTPPTDDTSYHPDYDRSTPMVGAYPWAMGPPNGTIDLFNDIFGIVFQFGHHCP